MKETDNKKPNLHSMDAAASRLTEIFANRCAKEQPARNLSKREQEIVWFTLHGMLSRGHTEPELKNFCLSVPISDPEPVHRPIRCPDGSPM